MGKLLYNDIVFPFGIDSDGNYGYYKAGADTVTPFKSGVEIIEAFAVTPPGTTAPLGFSYNKGVIRYLPNGSTGNVLKSSGWTVSCIVPCMFSIVSSSSVSTVQASPGYSYEFGSAFFVIAVPI